MNINDKLLAFRCQLSGKPDYKNLRLKAKSRKLRAGFTLIELLVVLGIFIIITSVVLARQNRFSSDILLTDLAYQVAITIRQAQVYGLGVKNSAITNFDIGYGVQFLKNTNTYILFADYNKNKKFDGQPPDTIVTTYQIQKGGTIGSICGILAGQSACNTLTATHHLNVVYIRPNPAANILGEPSTSYAQAVITVVSALGDRAKCVRIDQTGQVSVFSPSPNTPTTCP